MSISRQEEIISVLWLIAALLAFDGGYRVLGWMLYVKAGLNYITSLVFVVRESIADSKLGQNRKGQSND